MRIAASLSVKDEVELIEGSIDHLRRIGVDAIVACDMGSTDGTLELLERHRADGDFRVIQLNERSTTEEWSLANLEIVKKLGVDWVIFIDADEYPLPATGLLGECPELDKADVLIIDRFNIPVGRDGRAMPAKLCPSRYTELALIVEPIPNFREHWKQHPETPWIRNVPVPKIMARPSCIAAVTDCAHQIVPASEVPLARAKAKNVVIAHLPFTTRSRFARKIDNIRRVFEIHDEYMGKNLGWHWRRWLALANQGRLNEEFDRNIFSAETISALRANGVIRSVADVFRGQT